MVTYQRLAELALNGLPAALCIVTRVKGSTPRKPGARMVVIADGSSHGAIEGTVGGGAFEHRMRTEALATITAGHPREVEISLTHELGMCCGGTMTAYIEPLQTQPPCIIFGAGHIGQALARFAQQVGFHVTVADHRDELLKPEYLPHALQLIDNYTHFDFKRMPFGPNAFVIVTTHSHQTDQELVEHVLSQQFRYLALVGSKRKALLTIERCRLKNIAEDQIQRIQCPAGLDIAAQTPEEIALSIVGQMVQIRRNS